MGVQRGRLLHKALCGISQSAYALLSQATWARCQRTWSRAVTNKTAATLAVFVLLGFCALPSKTCTLALTVVLWIPNKWLMRHWFLCAGDWTADCKAGCAMKAKGIHPKQYKMAWKVKLLFQSDARRLKDIPCWKRKGQAQNRLAACQEVANIDSRIK